MIDIHNKKINFIISALNEEERIIGVIESIKDYAENIIILDPGSTDQSILYASKYSQVIICKVSEDMFDIRGRYKAAFAILREKTDNDWVFIMNCSEKFTPQLGNKLVEIINKEIYSGVNIYRQSYTFEEKSHHQKILYIIRNLFKLKNNFRLFRFVNWDESSARMHCEYPLKLGKNSKTTWLFPKDILSLRHYRSGNLRDFELKHSKYSENEAVMKFLNGYRTNFFKMIFYPLFVLLYFIPETLFNRKVFIIHIYHAFYKFQVEAKIYLMQKNVKVLFNERK